MAADKKSTALQRSYRTFIAETCSMLDIAVYRALDSSFHFAIRFRAKYLCATRTSRVFEFGTHVFVLLLCALVALQVDVCA